MPCQHNLAHDNYSLTPTNLSDLHQLLDKLHSACLQLRGHTVCSQSAWHRPWPSGVQHLQTASLFHRWGLHGGGGVASLIHRLCFHGISAYTIPPRRLLAVLSYAVLILSTTSFSRSQPLVMLDMSTQSMVSLRSCVTHRLAAVAGVETAARACTSLYKPSTYNAYESSLMANGQTKAYQALTMRKVLWNGAARMAGSWRTSVAACLTMPCSYGTSPAWQDCAIMLVTGLSCLRGHPEGGNTTRIGQSAQSTCAPFCIPLSKCTSSATRL